MKILNNYKYFVVTLGLLLQSCAEDVPGTELVVSYPAIVLNGEPSIVVKGGEPFTDPGATATENGEPIEVTTSVSGTYFVNSVPAVDATVPDYYTITYAAQNARGDVGTATRSVLVLPQNGDLVNSIEGLYTSTVVRDVGGGGPEYTDMEYVIIRKVDEDTYELSDGIGGYYDFGRVYGPTYAARGARITANNIPSNDFTFENTFGVGLFGGVAEITSMTVDSDAKTVTFSTTWDSGYVFDVTLTQVEYTE